MGVSADGLSVLVACYTLAPGSASPSGAGGRSVAIINVDGSVDTTSAWAVTATDALGGVASADRTGFYVSSS